MTTEANAWQEPTIKWFRRGDMFTVEVSRHTKHDGKFGWCVYAHVFEKHPRFAGLMAGAASISHDAVDEWPLHGGCTYFHRKTDEGGYPGGIHASVQVGCDYSHLYDDCYADMEHAGLVFHDADRLFGFMSAPIAQEEAVVE